MVIFDEAQRTYERGRQVARQTLEDHEADLILRSLEASYGSGATVVALLGENQAINRGERGAIAWLEAAERRGWRFAIGERTLATSELLGDARWATHEKRRKLSRGHLAHSMRFYRNAGIERWAHHVMEEQVDEARAIAAELHEGGDTLWLTRELEEAKAWARARRVGEERAGLIASGQARRLAAYGLHVELKPDIADWMLAPSDDVRSSNMLEKVQNTYQVQGLELDWTIVCWDADLRRQASGWGAFKLVGSRWLGDSRLDIAKNNYRVLLTRARKGMTLFVPEGDRSGEDLTRAPGWYDDIADHLLACGARPLVASPSPGSEDAL